MKFSKTTFLVFLSLIAFVSCKKDTDPNMQTFKIVKEMEKVMPGTTTATITGLFEYSGKINSIKVRVGTNEQLFGSDVFVAEVSGKAYSVNITGLRSGTLYHYRYEVDYGGKEVFLTEISDFTTLNELPTVKTIDVTVIDTTVFRIKCEVLSDGGLEVTERGICWNTYGDPTLDDETMRHSNGGLGQYTIRLENLTIATRYYVRAYAINATGVGYGEVLVLETTLVPEMSVSIVLNCNPEEGGIVNGAGSYTIGSQCTVTATANPTYTFVNWTENGTQVSSNATYTFTVSVERNLVANFEAQTPTSYTISTSANPSNGGIVMGNGIYQQGQQCTVTATASTDYAFINWTESGNVVSTQTSYTFTVNSNRNLIANFSYNGTDSHEYVDLGLPSGLLWATCNVGATLPEEYGDRYAWGEIQPKDIYSGYNYKYSDGTNYGYNAQLTKYCTNPEYGYQGFVDGLTILLPEDDAATVNWGVDWRMPTNEEWQELYQNTTYIWTTQNDVYGMLFTAANGNSLFLPTSPTAISNGFYWSSSLHTEFPHYAWDFRIYSNSSCDIEKHYRYVGNPIRAVRSLSKN